VYKLENTPLPQNFGRGKKYEKREREKGREFNKIKRKRKDKGFFPSKKVK
jgi:hypothetical protein